MSLSLMRASHIRSNLEELEQFGGPTAERVRARIAKSTFVAIEDAASVAWLPVEIDIDITRAVFDELGPKAVRKWSRDALVRSTEGPLLRPIIDGTRSLFGLTPHTLLKLMPRGFDLVYRGCGGLRYEEESEHACVLHHTGVPATFFDGEAYLEGMAGGFEAAILLGGADGTVELSSHRSAGTARYRAVWMPKAR